VSEHGGQAGSRLDQDVFEAMTEFVGQLLQRGEKLAERYGVPVSCMKALRRVERSVPMKELGQQLRCDPSFVTLIADALERRGLATREPHAADRRIKNLVLTARGCEVKAALEQEATGMMPWTHALDETERQQLLALVRKMTEAMAEQTGSPAASECPKGVVDGISSAALPVAP
jgi:DNA-binding MarR family transcriptional regulator